MIFCITYIFSTANKISFTVNVVDNDKQYSIQIPNIILIVLIDSNRRVPSIRYQIPLYLSK